MPAVAVNATGGHSRFTVNLAKYRVFQNNSITKKKLLNLRRLLAGTYFTSVYFSHFPILRGPSNRQSDL